MATSSRAESQRIGTPIEASADATRWMICSLAPSSLMRTRFVVLLDPGVEIDLQFIDCPVDFLSERNPIELIEYGSVEALAGLRALGLGARVIDVLDREVQLVFVMLGVAAILGTAIGQHPAQDDAVLLKERHTRSFNRSAAVIGVLGA